MSKKHGTNSKPLFWLWLQSSSSQLLTFMYKWLQFRKLLVEELPEQTVFNWGLGILDQLQSTAHNSFPIVAEG